MWFAIKEACYSSAAFTRPLDPGVVLRGDRFSYETIATYFVACVSLLVPVCYQLFGVHQSSTEKGDLSGSPGCAWLILDDWQQRPFVCTRDGCVKRYKRQDHLNRHLLRHEKTKFQCSCSGCIMLCCTKSNLQRHLRRHQLKGILLRGRSKDMCEQKKWKCPDPNCPKMFSYRCRVQCHYEIAHEFRYSEILCGEPGCGESFSEASDLSAHIWDSHRVVNCEQCGVPIARKSYKRHLMGHEPNQIKCRLQCPFNDCACSFTKSSNLGIHVKVAHMGIRDYKCTKENCGKVFGYKHARDNHEKTRLHCYLQGDFLEEDLKFRSRPRGGRKPVSLKKVDDLYRKRIVGPKQGDRVTETGCGMD